MIRQTSTLRIAPAVTVAILLFAFSDAQPIAAQSSNQLIVVRAQADLATETLLI